VGLRLQPMLHVVTVLPAAFFIQTVRQPRDFFTGWINNGVDGFLHNKLK